MTSAVAKLKVEGEYGSIYCDTIWEVQQLPVYTGSGPPLNLPRPLKHRHESKHCMRDYGALLLRLWSSKGPISFFFFTMKCLSEMRLKDDDS